MSHRPTVNDSENKNVGVTASRFVVLVSGVRHPTCVQQYSSPDESARDGLGNSTYKATTSGLRRQGHDFLFFEPSSRVDNSPRGPHIWSQLDEQRTRPSESYPWTDDVWKDIIWPRQSHQLGIQRGQLAKSLHVEQTVNCRARAV